jgi:small subunit ribosomal protein S8
MTMTDPIADMLTRLRNANQAYHDVVSMPYSKMKAGLAEILKQEGYITSYDVADNVSAEGEPSQGLLTDRQANQKGVGGEVLAYVW